MKSRLNFLVSTSLGAIMFLVVNGATTKIGMGTRVQLLQREVSPGLACLPDSDISTAVHELSTAGDYAELNRAKRLLLGNADRSPKCKKQVAAALMTAMDKPNLDLVRDEPSFRLWFYGSDLLGDLKALEALDLLLSHSELNDGTSFPLNHHPALRGVIKMGPIALPRLGAELRHNPDPKSRRYAVFCIAQIGGASAKRMLKETEPFEPDGCNQEFIRSSISALANKRLPNHITSEDRPRWYTAFLCRG